MTVVARVARLIHERPMIVSSTFAGLAALLMLSFSVNIPLGYLREGTARFSWRWFVWVHLSIPLIIAVRLAYGYSWRVIPLTIIAAVIGQVVGGRLYRRRYR